MTSSHLDRSSPASPGGALTVIDPAASPDSDLSSRAAVTASEIVATLREVFADFRQRDRNRDWLTAEQRTLLITDLRASIQAAQEYEPGAHPAMMVHILSCLGPDLGIDVVIVPRTPARAVRPREWEDPDEIADTETALRGQYTGEPDEAAQVTEALTQIHLSGGLDR